MVQEKTVYHGKNYKRECLMKKNYYFILAALMVFAAACTREDALVGSGDSNSEASLESSDVTYISAVYAEPGASKANIDDDAKFSWSAGDKVAVYAGGYKISDALAEGGSNAATFVFSGDELCYQNGRANFAVYPASLVFDGDGNKYTDNVTASSLMINLPATYNLSDVKDASAPTPMIAVNAPEGTLEFKSICALLKFTLHSVPKQTKYITFDFNDKKVAGEFEIENVIPGNDATKVENTETEEFDDVITVCNDNVFTEFQNDLVVNVPVPAGEYSKVTITSWDGDPWHGGHKINGITSFIRTTVDPADATKCLAWNAGRRSSGKREIYLPVFSFGSSAAIGEGKKIIFAPGNLTAEIETLPTSSSLAGTAINWRFAENQYDAINYSEDASANTFAKGSEGKRIDSFAWIGESATKNDYSDNELFGVLYPNFSSSLDEIYKKWDYWVGKNTGLAYITKDWGELSISGGVDMYGNPSDPYPTSTWRLASFDEGNNKPEFQYLFSDRRYASGDKKGQKVSYSACKASIRDGENLIANGLVVFPDHYDTPTVPVGMPTIVKADWATVDAVNGSHYSENILSLDQWAALEAVGCVFLPAASSRYSNSANNTKRMGDGVYWTDYAKSTNEDNNAIALVFSDLTASEASHLSKTDATYSKSFARYQGAAVRLIREIN